jgi:metal iron transporter
VKLGSVTGMTLAQMNRAYMPRWLNYALWVLAEASIICTDVGQVGTYLFLGNSTNNPQMIGTAIALNLLCPKIPLMAGCALAIADTLFILLFYRPDGSMRLLRSFEIFVTAFVLAVVVCFCVMLARITGTSVKHVMDGFLPSREIFVSEG